jgi:hypothetical protein
MARIIQLTLQNCANSACFTDKVTETVDVAGELKTAAILETCGERDTELDTARVIACAAGTSGPTIIESKAPGCESTDYRRRTNA